MFRVNAGSQVDIGSITIMGLNNVNESFVRNALTVHTGDRYKPSAIEAARQAIAGSGVFTGVSVRAAEEVSADGKLPLIFDVQERPQRTVSLSGDYSTDLGISLSATWSHHNLFGNAEQLNLSAAGTGLGGSATSALGYKLEAQFIKPYFLRLDQTLGFNAGAIKQSLDAYDQVAELAGTSLSRKFTPQWNGRVGLTAMHDEITQKGVMTTYELLALPVTANYDTTGLADLLRDPVRGMRASLSVTPTLSFGARTFSFFILQASGSMYFDVSGGGRSVIATRGLVGSVQGASNVGLPPDQRFYAGGSATVRGFKYQSIGPKFPDGDPVGGAAVDAATVEFRQRLFGSFGLAAFVDAGQASAQSLPFTGTISAGAGMGARYYTPIGAVRLDVAVPLTKVKNGDSFEIYVGLGQAF
jgi:translocation and assembly module TamA